ncbi:MAG TPA: hypothetical protein VMM15_10825 [Bradyrhizobium sp.]|nr:hypothetical protein [Bradyrhizobium sp.]
MRNLAIGPALQSPVDLKSDLGLFYLSMAHDLSVVRQCRPHAFAGGSRHPSPSPEITVTDFST